MDTKEQSVIPPDILAELHQAADRAAAGVHDTEAMKRACDRMDRMREELRRKHGDMNVAVDLIREARDEE